MCHISPDQIHGNELVLQEQTDGEVEVAVRAVQELAEDGTAGGLPHCPHLRQQQHDQVNQLLAKWKCVFAQDEEDFGETSAVLHQIPTGNVPPSRERYRTVPPSLYQELWSRLETMLEKEVIQESSSPWAAPIVCVDYHRLNALTHKDAYPLPRIEEALTTLNRAEWFSTLDLVSGYWQVKMDPADKKNSIHHSLRVV